MAFQTCGHVITRLKRRQMQVERIECIQTCRVIAGKHGLSGITRVADERRLRCRKLRHGSCAERHGASRGGHVRGRHCRRQGQWRLPICSPLCKLEKTLRLPRSSSWSVTSSFGCQNVQGAQSAGLPCTLAISQAKRVALHVHAGAIAARPPSQPKSVSVSDQREKRDRTKDARACKKTKKVIKLCGRNYGYGCLSAYVFRGRAGHVPHTHTDHSAPSARVSRSQWCSATRVGNPRVRGRCEPLAVAHSLLPRPCRRMERLA